MKLGILSLGLLSVSTLLPLTPSFTDSASACVQVAVGAQTRVSGEKNPKAGQNINTTQANDGNCFNNNVISVDKQTSVGSQAAQQDIQTNQRVGGGNLNNTGMTTPDIRINVPVQTDVYSPAHDPKFMNEMMQGTQR